MNQDETVFLNQEGVLVTNSRIQVDDSTYYIHNITSVKPKKIMVKQKIKKDREQKVAVIALGISGILFTIGFAGGLSSESTIYELMLSLGCIGGLICVLGLYIAANSYKRVPEYHVLMTSSAGEVDAYGTENVDDADALITAINDAMASRA